MAGTFTSISMHIVFSTKNRKPDILPAIQQRLYEYLGGIIRGEGGVLYAIGGMADHVHMLMRYRPDRALSDVVRDLKSHSSGWIHKTFPDCRDFGWQDGYGAFSVSQSRMDTVKNYVESQAQHHAKRDFVEEMEALLEAHRVEYDQKYLWK